MAASCCIPGGTWAVAVAPVLYDITDTKVPAGEMCRVRASPRGSTQPLPIKPGGVQPTIGEAAAYVLALPHAESCNRWRRAAQLLLDQADVAAVSKQARLALVYDPRLDIGAMPGR